MEGISANVYKGLTTYWKRQGYRRLNRHEYTDRAEPGPRQRRRFWRVKVGRRLRLLNRIGSPKKWLTRLRDAYVKMMLNFANSGLVSSGYGGPMDYGSGFAKGPIKEYDEKMIVEIYKKLMMAQGQLVHLQPDKLSSHPVESR